MKSTSLLKRLALVVAGVVVASHALYSLGAPLMGLESPYTQPDGTIIALKFYGDEFYARTETADGYTVVFDPAKKAYCFAALSPDNNEFVSTGQEVGKADPAKLGIMKSLKINPASRAAKAKKRYAELEAIVHQEARWTAVKEASGKYHALKKQVKEQEKSGKKGFVIPLGTIFPDSEIPAVPSMASSAEGDGGVTAVPPIALAPPSFQLSGDVVGLTILIDFSDDVGTIAQKDVDDYCNKPGFSTWGNKGSIYDYFYTQSASRLRYNNNVTYYVRVPQPKTYYNVIPADPKVQNSGTCGRLLLSDALDVLIANGYDFSKLTTKSGGYVRACNVLFAGANSGHWAQGLWPHRSAISAKSVGGGKYIYDYQITNMGSSLTMGTFCHENGHMLLGYPDYYDYATDNIDSYGMGSYTLMAYSGSGTCPHNIHGYLKWHSGWLETIELYGAATPQRCAVRVDSDTIYKYTNPSLSTEYFMIENRSKYGWEANGSLPDTGIFITHNDQNGKRDAQNMTQADHFECSVEQADGVFHLESNTNAGDASDLFHSGGTGPKTSFDDTTLPNAKWWLGADGTAASGTASGLSITNISAVGPTMTFIYGAGTPSGSPVIGLDANTIYVRCNYGANAASDSFGIFNNGGGTLDYTISDNQSWLSCSTSGGTATTESALITVNFSTSTLPAGSYSATITVIDPAASPTSKTITVNLTVNAQPVMSVSSATISANGLVGMAGPQASFAINNTGGGAMTYSLSKTQSWLTLSSTNGTVVAETDTIYVNFDATALGFGTYHDTITMTSPNASNSPLVIPVTLRVLLLAGSDIAITGNGLVIAPNNMTPTIARGTDYGIVSGPVEHTFGILNQSDVATLELTNAPKVTVSSPSGYFTLSQDAAAGSLAPGASTSFKITYNPQAGGIHTGTVSVASTDSALPRYSFALSGISVGMPAVTNYGAGPAEQATATLTGRLTAGGVAKLYLCWGAADGGTSSTGSWEHVVALGSNTQNAVFTNQVTGLLYGISYACRVYATNASGTAWSTLRNFAGAPPQPRLGKAGLISGTISGTTINTTTPNPGNGDGNAVTNMGPWRAKFNTGWGNSTTYVYTGQMYFDGTAYFFVESIDDNVWLKIGGTVYMNNTTWDDISNSGLISKPQGWYDFELRIFNGGGGSGYVKLNPGFQYHNGGGTSTNEVDNGYPEDPGNASLFRTAYVAPVSPNSISNTVADNITATTADLHGILKADLAVYTVTVFWSTNNNANAAAWVDDTAAASRVAGTYTNVANQLIAVTATNMPPSGAYYFTLRASNALTNMWAASNGSFYKIATPVVNTSTGATALTMTSARLSGTLSAGGTANAWICWGDNDAGVSSTSAWDHVQFVGTVNQGTIFSTTVTGLATNTTYFYRCTATNAAGADWSDTATSFSGVPSVGNGGRGYKMKISFANYNKTETLTNFPALVVFSNGMAGTTFDFSTFLSTNGYDLRFTDSTGTTNLNYEIDTWSTAASSYVWVQVPKLTNNCSIWARWGDASQASQPTYTTNGATWGNGYVSVWHMSQPNAQDSTIKKYNGVASGNTNCSGFVGGAQAFGTGNQLTIPTLPFTSNAVSVEAWVKHRTVPSTTQNYFRFNTETAVLRHDGATSVGQLHFYVKNGPSLQHVRVAGQIAAGPWYCVAGTFNGSQLAYKNGVQVGSASPGGTLVTTATSAFMGSSSEPMDGYIDEVRLSSVARSANWLWASYMTMASNSLFNTIGTVQSLNPIANLAPTALTNASALLNATLVSPETNYTVTVYWGPTDGGTNAGAWTNRAIVGSWSNVAVTNISHAVSGLVSGGVYYYTFCATNSQTIAWAFPSWRFTPAGTNVANKITPTVNTWPTGTVITLGQALSASTLSGGSASVPGSFTFNAPSTVPPLGITTAAVTFVANDSVNYQSVAGTAAVTVVPPPTYTLTVTNGTGSGTYVAGTAVPITADTPPVDQHFENWTTSSGGSFANSNAASTTYTMPANNAAVTANYRSNSANGTWLGASGNWSDTASWLGGTVADGTGNTAFFTGIDIAAAKTVTNNSFRTIGNITFTDATTASHDLTLAGSNTLTLDVTSGSPAINVTQSGRTLTINTPISGNDGLTKSGAGTLYLTGTNTYSGTTTIRGGTLVWVTGGACASSAVTVTNTPGNIAALAIRVTQTNLPWTCSSLAFTTNGLGSQLQFSFATTPSKTLAPLSITGNLTFAGAPVVVVNATNVPAGTYPLLVVNGATAPGVLPALNLSGSTLTGRLAWGGAGNKTLLLTLFSKGTVIQLNLGRSL